MNDPVAAEACFRVYSRPGCHLCEVLIDELLPLIRGKASLEVCDIDSRSDWHEQFGLEIPVVELNGERLCHFTLDRAAISAALRRVREKRPVTG
ncbi:MAG: glutaredoxin family protein [Woeseia sp.]|nr:glutaredoxin family protein [Woeseia sp.]MBT8096480.1 glutaredoxin family protein [Woeseia sp.]NNE59750.1 glutaredoxin family protein [Woeseia sp.]NNL54948.1 glutaredoxin family protein [Woeseia sp.]